MDEPTYKVGDYVQSSDNSPDVIVQGRRFRGTVHAIRASISSFDGYYYIVHGRWTCTSRYRITGRLLLAQHIQPWEPPETP